ncbi:MAG: lysophospholipid acyltransferase family protein [Planctomycetota bacterium]|jgi:lysophospholipid acyltransferase (LPLAT)-like uncharacterized protein
MPLFRVDPESAFGSFLLRFLGTVARWVIRLVGATCRYRVVEGSDRLQRLLSQPGPVLLVIWHDRAVLTACYLSGPFIRNRLDLALMISQSQDGQIVSHIVGGWKKVRAARGSTTRGGRAALRAVHRMMTKEQIPGLIAPDGPSGPRREFKVGAAVLAQMANAPVLPMALAPEKLFRLRSWDRLIVPAPFTRVSVSFGQPIAVPRGLSGDELEKTRMRLEAELNRTTHVAEQASASARDFVQPAAG